MADLSPVDFLSGLGGLQGLPNFTRDYNAGAASTQALHTTELQQQAASLQIQQQQEAARRQQQLHEGLFSLGNDPSPAATANFIRQFPEVATELKSAHDIQDSAKRDADFRQQVQIYSAAANGRPDLAARQLQAVVDADIAAGRQADPADLALIEAFNSSDPAEQKRALSMVGLHVASVTGAGKFADTFGALNKGKGTVVVGEGSTLVDEATGKPIYTAPSKPEYQSLSPGETLVEVGPGGTSAGTPAGDAPASALTVRNNNPGAIRFDPKNNWEGQVGNDGGFVTFDTVANGRRAHQKLIANQIKGGFDTPLAWAQHYAPASDGNDPAAYAATVAKGLDIGINDKIPLSAVPKMAAISAAVEGGGTPSAGGIPQASNGVRVVAQGAPKPGYRFLTPQEKAEHNLPAGVAFQMSPDGQVSAPSGQDTKTQQAQAVPASAQKSIIDNHSTIREIDRAIKLLEDRPESIGFGTSVFGDWFTQRNDPKGIPVRAAIGKIGGKIIHDISGAAVTMAEAPRFQPYVPVITDAPETALQKLRQMKALAEADQGDLMQAYGPENGYRGVKLPGMAAAPIRVNTAAEAAKLKPGTLYVRPDGQVMRR